MVRFMFACHKGLELTTLVLEIRVCMISTQM